MKEEQCKYFPCHNLSDINNFSCEFCYCPFYTACSSSPLELYKRIGGYKLSNNLLACENCILFHEIENVEFAKKEIIKQDKNMHRALLHTIGFYEINKMKQEFNKIIKSDN